MKIFHIVIAAIAVIATLVGVSAIQVRYSSISSSPFGSDGYGMVRVNEVGVGSYGGTWSPQGISGGYSARGSSAGFGYNYDTGLTGIGVRSAAVRGSWNRGFDGNSYGGFTAGPGHFRQNSYSINSYGNAWGSNAVYYNRFGSSAWGNGHNPYSLT